MRLVKKFLRENAPTAFTAQELAMEFNVSVSLMRNILVPLFMDNDEIERLSEKRFYKYKCVEKTTEGQEPETQEEVITTT